MPEDVVRRWTPPVEKLLDTVPGAGGGIGHRRVALSPLEREEGVVERFMQFARRELLVGDQRLDQTTEQRKRGNARACCCAVPRPMVLLAHHPNPYWGRS